MTHASPTRRFSALTFGTGDFRGYAYGQPYFWAIDDTKDLTVAPLVSSEQGINLTGDYRQLFTNGELRIAGSGTIADREDRGGQHAEDRFRGHTDPEGKFEIEETWRWGFEANRASDDPPLCPSNFPPSHPLETT